MPLARSSPTVCRRTSGPGQRALRRPGPIAAHAVRTIAQRTLARARAPGAARAALLAARAALPALPARGWARTRSRRSRTAGAALLAAWTALPALPARSWPRGAAGAWPPGAAGAALLAARAALPALPARSWPRGAWLARTRSCRSTGLPLHGLRPSRSSSGENPLERGRGWGGRGGPSTPRPPHVVDKAEHYFIGELAELDKFHEEIINLRSEMNTKLDTNFGECRDEMNEAGIWQENTQQHLHP